MVILGRARVSSLEQTNNSHALEQQIQRLISAGCTEILSETESGKSRKQLQRLIDRLKEGDVTEVVATRIDRITRSLVQLRSFVEFCEQSEINLRILDQHIDLKTSHGKLMLNMLGSVAEWEVDLLEERVKHGWQHLRNERRAPGIVPFGYSRDTGDRYTPNLKEYKNTGKTYWEVAREIVEVFLEIGTARGTAREMTKRYGPKLSQHKFSAEDFPREIGLKYWLCNPVLRGHLGYFYRSRSKETIVIADNHQALISPAEFTEMERLLELAKKEKRSTSDRLPLAGLVYCSLCGGKMKAFKNKKTKKSGKTYVYIRWYCSASYNPIPGCKRSPSIKNEVLEDAVIRQLIARGEKISQQPETEAEIIDTVEIQKLIESLRSLENLPLNPVFEEAKIKLKSQIEQGRIALRQQMENQQALKISLLEIYKEDDFWDWLDDSGLRKILRRFVRRVTVLNGGLEAIDLHL